MEASTLGNVGETGSVLDRESIRKLIDGQPPLVEALLDLDSQLQPNGIDLTLRSIGILTSYGVLGASPSERVLSAIEDVPFGDDGYVVLPPGSYLITLNEIVNLPLDLIALGRPRSTLLRCGVSLQTAVWDAGYSGRSQSLLVVHNSHGFRVSRDARVLHLVFFRLASKVSQGYDGVYQGENR